MGIRDPRIEKLSLAMVNQHAEAIVPFRSIVESKWLSLVVARTERTANHISCYIKCGFQLTCSASRGIGPTPLSKLVWTLSFSNKRQVMPDPPVGSI